MKISSELDSGILEVLSVEVLDDLSERQQQVTHIALDILSDLAHESSLILMEGVNNGAEFIDEGTSSSAAVSLESLDVSIKGKGISEELAPVALLNILNEVSDGFNESLGISGSAGNEVEGSVIKTESRAESVEEFKGLVVVNFILNLEHENIITQGGQIASQTDFEESSEVFSNTSEFLVLVVLVKLKGSLEGGDWVSSEVLGNNGVEDGGVGSPGNNSGTESLDVRKSSLRAVSLKGMNIIKSFNKVLNS